MSDRRQIFAFSGMLQGKTDRHTNFDLTNHAINLVPQSPGRGRRVCYVPTAVGDSSGAVEEGGSVVNLMAVRRAHGLPQVLRECWEAGVVLAGASAGSLCWHQGGPTDSFGGSLVPLPMISILAPISPSLTYVIRHT